MSQTLEERIGHIEMLLVEINSKLDNYLGLEELDEEEKEEIAALRMEANSGKVVRFDEIFKGVI